MSYSPFDGQDLKFHRFGKYNIHGYKSNVYCSEPFNFVNEKSVSIVVTVILHTYANNIKNPKLYFIVSEDVPVRSYGNLTSNFSLYENEIIRQWVDRNRSAIWNKSTDKQKNGVLPQIY